MLMADDIPFLAGIHFFFAHEFMVPERTSKDKKYESLSSPQTYNVTYGCKIAQY
jgi:hypothetical protein